MSDLPKSVQTLRKCLWDACGFEVEVGTNTPRGGDTGHGGVTVLVLRDLGGTDWKAKVSGEGSVAGSPKELRIEFYGDAEAGNLVKALQFAIRVLELQSETNRTLPEVEE